MYTEYDGIQDETDRFINYMAWSGIHIPVQGRTYATRGENRISFEIFVGGVTHIVSTLWKVDHKKGKGGIINVKSND